MTSRRDDQCLLCSVQKQCAEATFFLYAATPILREIVAWHLREMGSKFQLDQGLFLLTENAEVALSELRNRLAEAERADIRVSKERGAGLMAAPTLNQWDCNRDTEWLDTALRDDTFTTFFQPIVDTSAGEVFAHECLIRLFADRPYNGGEIMDAVISRGKVHLFDSYARRLSIRKAAAQHMPGRKVFVNFMPSSIYDPAYCMKSTLEEMSRTQLRPSDIVFEVVESDDVTDARHLRKICDYYRRENFGFALDDVGTGSSSFQMICDIKPDYIKLDKSLISRIADPMYLTAVQKLTEFAQQFGVKVIAEGIEEQATSDRLRALGISLMQGYYFGRPAPFIGHGPNDLVNLEVNLVRKLEIPETACAETSVRN